MTGVLLVSADLLKSHVKTYTRGDGTVVIAHDTKVVKKISAGLPVALRDAVMDAMGSGYTVKEDANFMRVFRVSKSDGHTTLRGLVIYPSGKVFRLPDNVEVPMGSDWRVALGLSSGKPKAAAKQGSLFGGSKAGAGKSPSQQVVAPQYGFGGFTGGLFGGKDWKKKPEPKGYHPKADEDGNKVGLLNPSVSNLAGFDDPSATVTVAPGDTIPGELNGIPFAPWTPPETWDDWADVSGQMDIEEPPLKLKSGKAPASGVLIVEPDGRAWVSAPSNGFGGYKNSFQKGKNDEDLPLQANAIKEAFEESGLKVEVIAMLGDVERTTSVTRYYLARRVAGSPADVGWESQAVSLVPITELHDFLDSDNDRDVVDLLAGLGEPAKD